MQNYLKKRNKILQKEKLDLINKFILLQKKLF